ncbi:MAG TPA: hypothetical protein DCG33_03255, partial [Prevotellaceae bacterium]|nr:hypothetical protein [Prevotellaceae bacterium]
LYYAAVLDKNTMRDVSRIEIKGGSIRREMSDLRESADLDCVGYDNSSEQYIRIWLDTKQNGSSSHIPLFTGIATSPGKKYTGRHEESTVECYSILKIVQDILLPRGWYAPAEVDAIALVKDLLKPLHTNIYIPEMDNMPTLEQAIIAENGESNLSMSDAILYAVGWKMRLDGYGDIYLDPETPGAVSYTLSATENDIIESNIDIKYDWFNCPNILRVVVDDMSAIARDDSPDSPYSTVTRGREVWAEESVGNLGSNETITEYATRRLTELQRVATEISYDRRFLPDLYPGDIIRLNYPAQNIFGNYYVTSQSISLGYGAKTSEEVVSYEF